MPGPKGFIHGWIYVGGPGLPAPGSPGAPDAPRWAPGAMSGDKPIGGGWRKQTKLEAARTKFPAGTRVRYGPQQGVVEKVDTNVSTGQPYVKWLATNPQGQRTAGPYAHDPNKLEPLSGPGVPRKVSVRLPGGTHRSGKVINVGPQATEVELDPIMPGDRPERRIVGNKNISGVTGGFTRPADLNVGTPFGETSRSSGPAPRSVQQLADQQLTAEAAPTKSVPRTRVTNKAQARERADKMVAAHGGDASAAIVTLDRMTPSERKGSKDYRLTSDALHETAFSQRSAELRKTPAYQKAMATPPPPPPGVGTPEDFTNRPTGKVRLGIGSTAQTPQGPGRIVGAGGSGASEKYSVELADGRTVVIGANQARPVEPRKGQRAEWIGSGIRGKVVAVDSDSVTIEHQELGNTVRKKFRKNEVSVVTPKRKRAS